MSIINDIKNSVYNPEFYTEAREASFGTAFKYFSKLSAIVAIVITIGLVSMLYPTILKYTSKSFLLSLVEKYPADLILTVKGGQLSTNLTNEPYYIKGATVDTKTKNTKENFLTIDTKSDFVLDNFEKYSTQILLTKNYIVMEEASGKITIQQFKNVPDTTIQRSTIQGLITKFQPYIKYLLPIPIIFMFIAFLIAQAFNLLYLLFGALLVLIIAKTKKVKLSYKKAYILGMYAITTSVIITALATMFGAKLPMLTGTVALLVICIINIKNTQPSEITPAPSV